VIRLLPPLYAILDIDLAAAHGADPLDLATAWSEQGVRLIQIRAKGLLLGPFTRLADEVLARVRPAGTLVIVNDRADVARLTGADGLHVGQHDLSAEQARVLLGDAALIGLSTHDAPQMRRAPHRTLSYLAIGPVFETTTKERPDPVVGLDGVREAASIAREAGLPLVAIGGITRDTAPAVLDAGADSVAVARDLLVNGVQRWLEPRP
jgi:thiamine-phosphate pyrophosphorylase